MSHLRCCQLQSLLCFHRTESNMEFMEDFSVTLLSRLLQTSVKLCSDSDKARYNAVRAVGNLLRYFPRHILGTMLAVPLRSV